MELLKKAYQKITSDEASGLKRIKTLCNLYIIKLIYNDIVKMGSALTITSDSMMFYKELGFNVKPEGVGYKITI